VVRCYSFNISTSTPSFDTLSEYIANSSFIYENASFYWEVFSYNQTIEASFLGSIQDGGDFSSFEEIDTDEFPVICKVDFYNISSERMNYNFSTLDLTSPVVSITNPTLYSDNSASIVIYDVTEGGIIYCLGGKDDEDIPSVSDLLSSGNSVSVSKGQNSTLVVDTCDTSCPFSPSTSFTILQVDCYVEDDGAVEDGYEEIYSTSYNFSNGGRVYPNNNGTLQTNGSLDDIMTVELVGSLNETSEDGNVVELLISVDFDVGETWIVLITSSDLIEAVPVSSVGMLTTTFVRIQFDKYHSWG